VEAGSRFEIEELFAAEMKAPGVTTRFVELPGLSGTDQYKSPKGGMTSLDYLLFWGYLRPSRSDVAGV